MAEKAVYLGIDLGTTNSCAAVFDGDKLTLVRNAQGGALTPSVVRIDARGNVLVGERARRALESDPDNTRSEFKRLMGNPHRFEFPASKQQRTAVELSAEVLRSIRRDVEGQLGVAPERAVISVPALFELPQTSATSEAARLAGFERIELIQEPVASAIASGWDAQSGSGTWLVYDLGGGTFDASLLDTQEGLLRVVGHDGDNFLGGRDIDASLVDWMIECLNAEGVTVDRTNPAHATALRRLRLAAEEAKIELSRAADASIDLLLEVAGERHPVSLALSRDDAERRMAPVIERTLEVCERLLSTHGANPGDLARVVLVGGPTMTPLLRKRVSERLGAPLGEGLDPMTLVAQGASLFAASVGLDARPDRADAPAANAPRVWLQFPAMTSDLTPFVVGKVLDPDAGVTHVRFERDDRQWKSTPEPLDAEGTFAVMLSLEPRKTSEFRVLGRMRQGDERPLHPALLRIAHGVTLGEPPLSRSIGVALANDTVQVYLERGCALPTRRTFSHRTAENVSPGATGFALRIPIVQGEFALAHLCRLVGVLEIRSEALKAALPAGSDVEVTLDVDRGGQLRASARVPRLNQMFDQVAQLVVPELSPEALGRALAAVRDRTQGLRAKGFRTGDGRLVAALGSIDVELMGIDDDLARAGGGDPDAGQKAGRRLIELDARLADLESQGAWPELEESARHECAVMLSWLAQYGTAEEHEAYARCAKSVERALAARNAGEVERQLRVVRRLGTAAYFRAPGAWEEQLMGLGSRLSEANDLVRAKRAYDKGMRARERSDAKGIESAVRELWAELPEEREERRLSYDSGVR
jgi:molecular chaperone DnaK